MSYAPHPQQQVIYQQVVRPPSNGMAVTALILGLVAIVTGVWSPIPFVGLVAAFFAFVSALLAVIFGIVGLRKANTVGVGRGNSVAGIVTGALTLGIIGLTTVAWIVAAAASSASYSGA
ncbi:hypothetical protein [Homoserinimonas hongtaonis]|uniref:hypothetical protein n=1 Tax=Homoserinimonas hongtaonis TaxID=2079791 RepID=UPI0018EF454F|nr:hypothetical protein [Salinibacterium hongtaonis]